MATPYSSPYHLPYTKYRHDFLGGDEQAAPEQRLQEGPNDQQGQNEREHTATSFKNRAFARVCLTRTRARFPWHRVQPCVRVYVLAHICTPLCPCALVPFCLRTSSHPCAHVHDHVHGCVRGCVRGCRGLWVGSV